MAAEWREAILAGVREVPKPGTPGSMVVCGLQAEPILTTTTGDVVMAAAEFGTGRVVVFSHDTFAEWFLKGNEPESAKPLKKNVLDWVTQGRYSDGWNMVDINLESVQKGQYTDGLNVVDLNPTNVMIWNCAEKLPVDSTDVLLNYVQGGGNLVLGITTWGYVHVHGVSHIETIPAYLFLKSMGIYLTSDSVDMSDPTRVEENKASEAHAGRALQGVAQGSTKLSVAMAKAICFLHLKDSTEVLSQFGLLEVQGRPPTEANPLSDEEYSMALLANLSLKATGMSAPGIDQFPGNFPSAPATSTVEVAIDSAFSEAHPVGAYLPAGATLSIQVLQGDLKGWKVQVGCHTDNLTHGNHKVLKRWPDITVSCDLSDGTREVSSPFGGSIYMWSPEGRQSIEIWLNNVVPSPVYRYGGDLSEWETSRQNPGLWADFVGKYIMITVPSKEIRDLADPDKVMEFWDSVVVTHNDLKGDDVSMKRREWIVPDLQPSIGGMHSGYPIVTHMDVASKSSDSFLMRKPTGPTDKFWGFFHELGHNLQDSAWTFEGTLEVTNNIFSLNASHHFFGETPWENFWLQEYKPLMKSYIVNGAEFKQWQDTPGIGLGIYAQLARDFGFDAYKQVFRQYKQENPSLSTDQEKIDHWVVTFSDTVKRNLVPTFKIWGIPISEKVSLQLEAFPPYKSEDEVTSFK